MLVHTVVKQLGFFVQGCHVPAEKYIEGLLGMETTHFADGVIGAPPVYYLPFYIESSLLLLLFAVSLLFPLRLLFLEFAKMWHLDQKFMELVSRKTIEDSGSLAFIKLLALNTCFG